MRSPVSSRVRGFTLVELMVAMVLALLILAAIGGLYVSTKQTFRVQDNTSGIDEVLRAIEEDMATGEWDAAMVLVRELAERFGYRADAEEFRARIEAELDNPPVTQHSRGLGAGFIENE